MIRPTATDSGEIVIQQGDSKEIIEGRIFLYQGDTLDRVTDSYNDNSTIKDYFIFSDKENRAEDPAQAKIYVFEALAGKYTPKGGAESIKLFSCDGVSAATPVPHSASVTVIDNEGKERIGEVEVKAIGFNEDELSPSQQRTKKS